MLDKAFFDELKNKYNYSEKTLKALAKIIPCIISYYGEEYEYIILEAILNTEIINCNSKQTISKVLNERTLTKKIGDSYLGNIDLKRAESIYMPNVKIVYNENINSYEIDKIDRIIVTSHTFNYDSPKGLEVLTHALCHLVKSYKDEITINENMITIRNGLSYEERKIKYGDEITLEFNNEFGKGLEEGFNIFDTEMIVSMVLGDTYKCYDYDSIYTIAVVLKEKYNLIKEINYSEMSGDIEEFRKVYGKDSTKKLSKICDDCLNIENDMLLSYTREDKDNLANILKEKLNKEAYDELVKIYKNSKSIIKS
ncbi:MAG: hypothetical protein ACI4PE_00400 [Bacilli bacterium]